MRPGVEGVRGNRVAGGVGAVPVQSDPAPGVGDRPVQHGVNVVRPVLVPPRAGGSEGVRVVEQPQRRGVPGTTTAPELPQQTADLSHEVVLRLAGGTAEPVKGPAEELALSAHAFRLSLALHHKKSRPLRQRETPSVPERLQARVEQVQGGTVGVGALGHFVTVGRPFRTAPARGDGSAGRPVAHRGVRGICGNLSDGIPHANVHTK